MNHVLIRFLGDPCGYRVPDLRPTWPHAPSMWVEAFVGGTTRRVWIDVAKAYLIEPQDQPFDPAGLIAVAA